MVYDPDHKYLLSSFGTMELQIQCVEKFENDCIAQNGIKWSCKHIIFNPVDSFLFFFYQSYASHCLYKEAWLVHPSWMHLYHLMSKKYLYRGTLISSLLLILLIFNMYTFSFFFILTFYLSDGDNVASRYFSTHFLLWPKSFNCSMLIVNAASKYQKIFVNLMTGC